MRIYFFPLLFIAYTQTSLAVECNVEGGQLQIHKCTKDALCISHDQTTQKLEEENIEDSMITCRDVNFDGATDILVEHPPAGQIQMTSIFLFQKENKSYEKNEELSNLPCLEINPKEKTVSGVCFSSSACDRWSETYIFDGNSLKIISTKGTYCDPSTGIAYRYFENYKDGKVIDKQVERLSEGK